MNILFLMGGNSDKNKEDYPLYLTEVKGKTILEKQIESAEALHPESIIFCMKETEIKQYSTDSVISQLVPNAKIIPITGMTKGAICTALLASEYVDTDEELLIMAIDDFILGLPGVLSAEVNLPEKTATVSFDPAKASVEVITKAIERTGFEVESVADGVQEHSHGLLGTLKRFFK